MSRLLYTSLGHLARGLRATGKLDGKVDGGAADVVVTTDFRENRAIEQPWRA